MQSAIRPASSSDIPGLLRLAESFPLSSLPANRQRVQEIVRASQLSFEKKIPIDERRYVFVLTAGGQLAACSQILARHGRDHPYFVLTQGGASLCPSVRRRGRTGLGGLAAAPEFRRSPAKIGRQIGLFRLLFVKAFAHEFTKVLEVSLTAPRHSGKAFYKAAAKPPMPANYSAALKLCAEKPKAFQCLCARAKLQAIPLSSASPALQAAALGAVHKETLPAYKGLLKIGFQKTFRRHILDGGIFLEAKRERMAFYRNIRRAVFRKKQPQKGQGGKAYLWGRKLAGAGFEGGQAEGSFTKDGAFLSLGIPSQAEGERLYLAPLS